MTYVFLSVMQTERCASAVATQIFTFAMKTLLPLPFISGWWLLRLLPGVCKPLFELRYDV